MENVLCRPLPSALEASSAPPPVGKRPRDQAIVRRPLGLRVVARIAREPLVHFVLLGALLFAAAEVVEHYRSQYRIVISADQRTRLVESYRSQYGALPRTDQFAELLRNYIEEEVLYREAVALGLDQGDEIVRRRLAQKLTFLQNDLALLDEPAAADLQRWYRAHLDRYTEAPRRTFNHIYFSPDVDGDSGARNRAELALARVNALDPRRAPGLGDDFPGSSDLADLDGDATQRLFGRSEIVQGLFAAPLDHWSGPYRSGFGWHLLRVTDEKPARVLPFEDVATRVRQDYQDARRKQLNRAALAALLRKYQVVLEDGR